MLTAGLLLFSGCGSSDELVETTEDQPEPEVEIVDDPVTDEDEGDFADDSEPIEPEEELEPEVVEEAENGLRAEFARQANNVTQLYITAQQLFYNGNFDQALVMIRQANEVRDNPDIKALKGSIYLALGSREKFEENWRRAFEMDDDVPIPNIPFVQRELQNIGLID